jgi:receptor protein-tyrosine kinase
MDLKELLDVLWRRKLVVLAVTLAAIAAAYGVLRLVTPLYESSSTLAVQPTATDGDLFFLTTIDTILPVYAEGATSRTTRELAAERVPDGTLGEVAVRTFSGTPILKIKARDEDPDVAEATAQSVTEVLIERAESDEVGVPGLRLTQIERPVVAGAPVFPRKKLTLLVAGLLGFALGIGAALLRETLTSRVETRDHLADLAGAPVFAEFPTERAVSRIRRPEALTDEGGLRAFSESLRDLRTSLVFTGGDSLRSVAVTSPEGSHGKTTIAFGLAATLARAGTRTLLVDGDLRKGRVAELLLLHRSPGLRDALEGAPVEQAIQRTSLETLDVLPGGQITEDPGELILNEFGPLLAQLEERYECVVVDCTPLVPVNDARLMARSTEAVIVVASAGRATRRQIRSAVERLSVIDITPTAAVLNNSRRPRGKGYYGYLETPRAPRRRLGLGLIRRRAASSPEE